MTMLLKLYSKALAIVLIISLFMPSFLFGTPEKVSADSMRRLINHENPLLMITMPMGHNTDFDPDFRRLQQLKAPLISEHVFPVMFHAKARAGMDVCPKIMKESFQSLQLATSLGAAQQY